MYLKTQDLTNDWWSTIWRKSLNILSSVPLFCITSIIMRCRWIKDSTSKQGCSNVANSYLCRLSQNQIHVQISSLIPYHEIETRSTQYYDYIYNGYLGKLRVSYNLGWKLFSSHALKEKEVYMVTLFFKKSTNLSVCDMAKVVNSHWK